VIISEKASKNLVNLFSLDKEKARMRLDKAKNTPHPALSPQGERGY